MLKKLAIKKRWLVLIFSLVLLSVGLIGGGGDLYLGYNSVVVVGPYIESAVLEEVSAGGQTLQISTSSDAWGWFYFDNAVQVDSVIRIGENQKGLLAGKPYDGTLVGRVVDSGSLVVSPLTTLLGNGFTPEEVIALLENAGIDGLRESDLTANPMSGLVGVEDFPDENLARLQASVAVDIFMQRIGNYTWGPVNQGGEGLLAESVKMVRSCLSRTRYQAIADQLSATLDEFENPLTFDHLIKASSSLLETVSTLSRNGEISDPVAEIELLGDSLAELALHYYTQQYRGEEAVEEAITYDILPAINGEQYPQVDLAGGVAVYNSDGTLAVSESDTGSESVAIPDLESSSASESADENDLEASSDPNNAKTSTTTIPSGKVRQVRYIETPNFELPHPAGLTYLPASNTFIYIAAETGISLSNASSQLMMVTFGENAVGSLSLPGVVVNRQNIAFDRKAQLLYLLDDLTGDILELGLNKQGRPDPQSLKRASFSPLRTYFPTGMDIDASSGVLYILFGNDRLILRVRPNPEATFRGAAAYATGSAELINLSRFAQKGLKGLAYNPTDRHLYTYHPVFKKIFEISENGLLVSDYDLRDLYISRDLVLQDSGGMVFADSGDRTDDPATLSLYITDSGLPDIRMGGKIVELALNEPKLLAAAKSAVSAQAVSTQSDLVRVIDVSQFSPPSPDPAGLAFHAPSNHILFSDSEVNETAIFTGANLFEMSVAGNLTRALSTTDYSREPTGLAFNTVNGHLFVSDDNDRRVFEIDPGSDGVFDTPDDLVSSFDTLLFDSDDPEGVAFDSTTQTLYIVDGVNSEVYLLLAGTNQVFDGPPPDGDDSVSQFDTASVGVVDPEGIVCNQVNGNLYLVGHDNENLVAEVSSSGVLLQEIDISAANANAPSALAIAPSSVNPQVSHMYIADRGVDNNNDPDENDGKIYEMTLPGFGSDTIQPTVTAFDLPDSATILTVPILTFTATDNVGVTGYLATESASAPAATDPGWQTAAPTAYTFASVGSHILYGWAKDAAGNVSTALSDTVTIIPDDTVAPTVTAFELPDTSNSLTVTILAFTATDDVGVTGYLVTESASAPSQDDLGWQPTSPIEHTFGSDGIQVLYGWAMDAAGNISAALSDTVAITLADTESPTVTVFDLPATATTLTVPILTFSASDDVGVTGYQATESATPPAAFDLGWQATPPTEHTFGSDGSQTLYGWAKDAAGNVSAGLGDTVVISLPDSEAPTVTAFDLPDTSSSLTVPILTFIAADDTGVTGYLATETATPPSVGDPRWSDTAPTEHTFAAEGSQTLYGWAKDAAGNISSSLSDTVVISTNPGQQQTDDIQVALSSDDAEESRLGGMDLTSSDLELGTEDGSPQTVGLLFTTLAIPQGATIVEAYIQFTVDEVDSGATSVVFRGQADDNAATFDSINGNIRSRPLTAAGVSWSPAPWTVVGLAGADQKTPNLAPIIQEIVDRSGWAQGNSLVITITGSGERTAESFDGQSASAPLLHVSYLTGDGGSDTTPPVVTAFDLPTTSDSLTVPIVAFTATDNVGVTGFLATETATVPLTGDPGWTASAPTTYTFASDGSQTLYGWAKDEAGNISAALSDTVTITLPDTEAPTVTVFDLPETTDSLTVQILAFAAIDNVGVTGYLATETATAPSAVDPGWTASVPLTYTFVSDGSQTLYGWAKDEAGNVSAALSDTVVITLPDTVPPEVTVFDLPATDTTLTVPILSFDAIDDVGVTGYLATESATAPSAETAGWTSTPPTEHTFSNEGSQTLYGWAKDAGGNVSDSLSDTVTITLPDTEAPVVNAFDLPATSDSLTVSILTFTATDNVGVTGYQVTESASPPEPFDINWSATPPTDHTFSGEGSQTLHGWAKDAAGNVSAALNDTVVITLPDTEAPVVTAFDLPATATSLTVPILTYAASDNVGVTGYLATESATAPSAGAAGWTSTPPTEHTFSNEGSQTLYGWAKDAAGNVSAALSDTVTITLADTEAPTVTAFDLPATATSLTVPILFFAASDNVEVTAYLATESATAPSAGAAGWTALPPTEHTFSSEGSQTLYGWAKDAAGNVSTALSDTVAITLPDTEAPTVTAFDLPATAESLTVPILSFAASDNVGVTGYLATETATAPSAGAAGWTTTPPTEHTFGNEGSQTLYGWAKDAAGNISAALSDTVAITLPDTEAPTVTAFDLPATAESLTMPILSFTATDNIGVTGYLATETATAPSAGAAGWTSTPPTEHTFASEGSQTLYGWARDAAGNVSAALSDTVTITLGTIHIGDLDGSVKVRGKSGNWEVLVTVTVHDQSHTAVAGAAVSGTWSGDTVGAVSGLTDDVGNVTLVTGNFSGGSTVTLTVAGVSHADFDYTALNNHDPDGDSDGSVITLVRP